MVTWIMDKKSSNWMVIRHLWIIRPFSYWTCFDHLVQDLSDNQMPTVYNVIKIWSYGNIRSYSWVVGIDFLVIRFLFIWMSKFGLMLLSLKPPGSRITTGQKLVWIAKVQKLYKILQKYFHLFWLRYWLSCLVWFILWDFFCKKIETIWNKKKAFRLVMSRDQTRTRKRTRTRNKNKFENLGIDPVFARIWRKFGLEIWTCQTERFNVPILNGSNFNCW